MRIDKIGELQSHHIIHKCLISSPIDFPYFDGLPLAMILDGLEDADENEAIDAIESFLRLGPEDRLAASPYVQELSTHCRRG